MKIAVCIKQVPGTTAVEVDPVTGTLKRDGVESKLNPYDLYALEAALRLKSELGAEITAVTMGPPQAAGILREAYMMGVDHAVLVSDRKFAGADVLATSYTLFRTLEQVGEFDLIICGRQTTDGDTAQVGAELAEFLGIPHVANVIAIEAADRNGLTLCCDLPRQTVTLTLPYPALIAVEKNIGEPRLPSYRLKLATAELPVQTLSLADLADQDENHYGLNGSPTQVIRIFPPENTVEREWFRGSADELAGKLHAYLGEHKFLQLLR